MAPGRGANRSRHGASSCVGRLAYPDCLSILARNTRLFILDIAMPLAFLFPFSCMAIWAGNGIVSKLAVRVLSPAALAWSRWMVAALVLTRFWLTGPGAASQAAGRFLEAGGAGPARHGLEPDLWLLRGPDPGGYRLA
jgi:hypothetical protein